MMNPTFLAQLRHDGVDPGKAGLAVRPLGQSLRVLVPRNLNADRIPSHFIEVGILRCAAVEKLAPQELTVEAQRRTRLFDILVQIGQLVVEESR